MSERGQPRAADRGVLAMGIALAGAAAVQVVVSGPAAGVAAGTASVVLVVTGVLLAAGPVRHRVRVVDPVVALVAAAGLAIDQLAAAVTYAPGLLALDADAAGLHVVAALLLGSAGALLAVRTAGAAAADGTSTSVLGVLGTALVVLGAFAAHDGDAVVWWQRAVVAQGLAGAALAGIHLRRST